jgi:hypothetical protein
MPTETSAAENHKGTSKAPEGSNGILPREARPKIKQAAIGSTEPMSFPEALASAIQFKLLQSNMFPKL